MEQGESAPAKVSAWQSIWGVLLAPEATFRSLAARPSWLPSVGSGSSGSTDLGADGWASP